jgi:hypothetical protein
MPRWTVGLLAVALGSILAACGSSTPKSTTTAAPSGWKIYTFDYAAISVPGAWAVAFNSSGCPTGAPGLLVLANPPFKKDYCPNKRVPNDNTVTVVAPANSNAPGLPKCGSHGHHMIVNDLVVCPGMGSPSSLEWWIPLLGLQVTGSGPLASQVMHTLRRA